MIYYARREEGVSPTCETNTVLTLVGLAVMIISMVGVSVTGTMVGAAVTVGAAENVGFAEGENVGICDGAPVGVSTVGASTTAAGIAVTKLVFTAVNVVGFAKIVSIAAADTVGE